MATKILSAQQIRQVEAYTIEHKPVTSIALMELATDKCVETFVPYLQPGSKIHVFCGSENNGGDGLVIARLLRERYYEVHVYCFLLHEPTPEFRINKARVPQVADVQAISDLPAIERTDVIDVIIDALLGIGASRKPEGLLEAAIRLIITGSQEIQLRQSSDKREC